MKKILIAVACLVLALSGQSPAFTGSSDLSWEPPRTFANGAPLVPATDLAGYRLYCSMTQGTYPAAPTVVIPGGATTTYTLTGLGVGTTYCVITAVSTTANGAQESARSNEGSKTISAPQPGGCSTFRMN